MGDLVPENKVESNLIGHLIIKRRGHWIINLWLLHTPIHMNVNKYPPTHKYFQAGGQGGGQGQRLSWPSA